MHIGLDNVYYSIITENSSGEESYGTPKRLSPALSAIIKINRANTPFYADDGLNEEFDDFIDGTITLNVKDLPATALVDFLGVHQDANGAITDAEEDQPVAVALLFRSMIRAGEYGYFVLYKVKFKVPDSNYTTKGSTITVNTPTIEGKIYRRNKLNARNEHPWRIALADDGTSATTAILATWFTTVYEYVAAVAQSGSGSGSGQT